MIDIAQKLIKKEILNGNLVANTSGTFTFSGNRYNKLAGDITPHWLSTTVSTDTAYNNALKTEILRLGTLRAASIAKGLSSARYKGSLVRKGDLYSVGDLLKITNSATGQNVELIRVMDTRDNIDKTGWKSTLEIEQDSEAVEGYITN